MTTAQAIGQVKKDLKLQFVQNKPKTFQELKALILDTSPFYNQLLLIESQHNTADSQRLMNLITNEEVQVAYNLMTAAFLALVDKLEIGDFNPDLVTAESPKDATTDEPPGPAKELKKKEGHVAYRIPGKMQVNQNSRCIIRVSWDELLLKENLKQDVYTRIEAMQVSNVMQVGLEDFSGDDVFQIRPINDAEQFIVEDEVTKWLFNVKPLIEGTHTLTLKVAVIEPINGKERKREIVLEENIEIITEDQAKVTEDTAPKEDEESEFKPLLAFSFFPVGGIKIPPAEQTSKPEPKPKKGGITRWVVAAISVMILLLVAWYYQAAIGTLANDLLNAPEPTEQLSDNSLGSGVVQEEQEDVGNTDSGMKNDEVNDTSPDEDNSTEAPEEGQPNHSGGSNGNEIGESNNNQEDNTAGNNPDNDNSSGRDPAGSGNNGGLNPDNKPPGTGNAEEVVDEEPEIDDSSIKFGSVKDKDRNKYRTLKLADGNTWLVEDNRYEVEGLSWCYNGNCDQPIRLYNYEGAVKACEGLRGNWRLPTKEEWEALINAYAVADSSTNVDFKLAFTNLGPKGNSHFDAGLNGYAVKTSSASPRFNSKGVEGYYWASTEYANLNAYGVYFNGIPGRNQIKSGAFYLKSRGQSCRCIKN